MLFGCKLPRQCWLITRLLPEWVRSRNDLLSLLASDSLQELDHSMICYLGWVIWERRNSKKPSFFLFVSKESFCSILEKCESMGSNNIKLDK